MGYREGDWQTPGAGEYFYFPYDWRQSVETKRAAASPAISPASTAGCRRTPRPRSCSATPSAGSSRATR